MDALRQSGVEVVGAIPWGTHFCQFYQTSQDLVETLVPYFREGLAARELCMWVTSSPLQVKEAKAALRVAVPDLDDYIARGQIEILDYSDWYLKSGEFQADEVLQSWVDKHDDALRRGFEGLRLTGNTLWLEQAAWEDFAKYEESINNIIGQHRMLAICTYSLEKCGAQEIAEVIATHQFALIKRSGRWEVIESSRHRLREAALLEASRSLLRHREFEAAARSIFDSCKKLIGATAGYVAMLSRDGTENEILFLESGGLPCTVDDSLPMPIRGLRAAAYRDGKTVYENDFANSEWVGFLPPGHAQLDNVLFAPLAVDGAVVGVLGLANKPGGFTEDDARMASAFAELAAVALHNSRTLEALEQSEDRYRSLVETAVDAIISIDSDGNIILWNHSAESMFGYRADDVMGKPLDFIMPERFREAHRNAFQRVLSTGKSKIIGTTAELAGLRRTGVEFPLELSVAKRGSGDAVSFTAVIRDITERKQADEEINSLARFPSENPNPVLRVSGDGTLLYANEASKPLLRESGAAIGGPAPPFLQALAREVLDKRSATTADIEEAGRTWSLSVSPVVESGDVNVYGRDVTERKQAEEALRESREDLNRAQAVAHTGSWRLDVRRNELIWSDETYRMFGIPKGTPLTYEAFLEAVHPEDREHVDQAWTEALQGQPYEIEHRIVVGDTVKWVRERAELEVDKHGTLLGGFGTVQDITERRQAEQAIEQEHQRLQTLVDASPVGIVLADADGTLLLVNREAERIFGYSHVEGDSGWHDRAVRRRPDGSVYTREELPLERALQRGETVLAEEVWFHFPDGRIVPTLTNAIPLLGASGEITGAIAIIQDISPLEEIERLRSEFLGMVTHELKTPLTAIKGSAATALGSSRPLDTAQVRELFQIIDGQADRLRELVDDLLDMTRVEAGSLSINPEPLDLRAVIEEVLPTLARSAGLREVRLELPDDLALANADRGRIGQVMTNFLTNAAKFSPPETPITVSAEQDALSVTVHVRDGGRGIAREKLPLLFKKFSRLHEDSGHGLSSTGLGLAICKGIIEAHGGRIWADSAGEGQGTTFSFTLPVAAQDVSVAPASVERGPVQTQKVTRPSERTRVLAVDDEPQILRYLQRSLSEAGYQAIVTGDPSQVVGLVELEEPDLVVLDLKLPGTSGFDLLQRIRELSEVPVIFLTASGREEDAVQALKSGADDYITKPFSPSELLARIEAVLRRRAAAGTTEAQHPLAFGDLTINFAEREVTLAGQPVSLSATEYKLLYELAAHAGRVLTYDQILARVWGPEYSGETELVRSFIRNLRRKLGEDARNPRFILTERQVGYRMPKPQG